LIFLSIEKISSSDKQLTMVVTKNVINVYA